MHKSWISGGKFSSQARLHADFKAFSCSLLDQDTPKSSIDEHRASQLLFELPSTQGAAKTVTAVLCLNGSNRGPHHGDTAPRSWAVIRVLTGHPLECACSCHRAHVSLGDCPTRKQLRVAALPSSSRQARHFLCEAVSWEKGETASCGASVSASCDLLHMK